MKCRICLDVGYILYGPETIAGQEQIKCRECMEKKEKEESPEEEKRNDKNG